MSRFAQPFSLPSAIELRIQTLTLFRLLVSMCVGALAGGRGGGTAGWEGLDMLFDYQVHQVLSIGAEFRRKLGATVLLRDKIESCSHRLYPPSSQDHLNSSMIPIGSSNC